MAIPTIRGLRPGTLQWQPDFSATIDNKDKWEASVSFVCHLSDVVALRPQKGAPCAEPGFAFLTLDGATVENIGGGLGRIVCKYTGGGTDEVEFGFDDEESGGYRTELAISTSEEPLLSHWRYKDVSPEDRVKIGHLQAGRGKPTEVPGEYILKTDSSNGKKFTFTDERAAELAEKISKGITSYLCANQVYRIQYTSKKKVSAAVLNKCGKISAAKGAPSINEDRDWLFVGASVNEQGDDTYNVSLEWRLSGPGGWDAELYGEGDE